MKLLWRERFEAFTWNVGVSHCVHMKIEVNERCPQIQNCIAKIEKALFVLSFHTSCNLARWGKKTFVPGSSRSGNQHEQSSTLHLLAFSNQVCCLLVHMTEHLCLPGLLKLQIKRRFDGSTTSLHPNSEPPKTGAKLFIFLPSFPVSCF